MSASLTRRVIYFMQLALYHMYRYWRLDQEGLLDHYAQMSKVQVSDRHLRRGIIRSVRTQILPQN